MSLARACPLCGGRRARPVWRENGHRYVRCAGCSLVMSDVGATEYTALRHNAWDEAGLDAQTQHFYGDARSRPHRALLRRLGGPGGRRLLDAGCGLGVFVQRALEAGWDAYGCDTSSTWVERARRLTAPERIEATEVHPGLFGGGFDVVTAWDVIEHVYDPVPFLRALRAALAPGGVLFLRTPNLRYVLPVYAARRHALHHDVELGPLNHVVYFTDATLRRALDAAGLTPVAWPVLEPPQVGPVALKNAWAGGAAALARVTAGRVAVGSDLDVLAAPKG